MKYFKKLEGSRIYLSPMNIEDAETYVKWLNDLRVSDGVGNSSWIISLQAEKEWINQNVNSYNFAIVLQESDTLIGNCGINNLHQISRHAEIGIFIGDEDNRSKGYGAEALRLLLGFCFDYLNLNNVMLKVFSFNERAINCYKKVGFKEVGRRRQSYYLRGKYYDDVYMDILREEWYQQYSRE